MQTKITSIGKRSRFVVCIFTRVFEYNKVYTNDMTAYVNATKPVLMRMTRRYTSEIGLIIGPDKDIPTPDVNTNEQTMAWMMVTYSMN
jgi:hypothetical protein